jgi:Phage integrase, N-terminal SAM-like domain
VTHCRQIMLEELQRRNFAPTTIATYLHAVEQFARHFKCRPDRLNQTHFRSYQAYLLRERKLRPLTVRLHVAALRFFFVKTLKRRYLLDDTPYPTRDVSHGLGCHTAATSHRIVCRLHAHALVAVPALWRAHAHRRPADRASDLPRGAPRRRRL